jgi:16S rRNA (guanine(1405)-N(7))-methyltransferase
MISEADVEAVVTAVKQSRKYRDTHEGTIRALAADALHRYKKVKDAEKAVRKQLHSIMAPYLGDPDYAAAAERLTAVYAQGDAAAIKTACRDILHSHLSTRERLPIMEAFYSTIFAVTGRPASLIDVACGLNPLAWPWMGLDAPLDFYAYDIHEPRIAFINHFFRLAGLPSLARVQDVAANFPQETADVALFLKEMPRFERNYHGQGRPLLAALRARWLVISFPSISTHGGRNLSGRYRAFMFELIEGQPWPVTELSFADELVFCVDKGPVFDHAPLFCAP